MVYTIACGSATSSVTVAVKPPVNTVSVTVDAGPAGADAFNIPFVSVTVCRPGTDVCQTIDHVMVDTGSYGLRLIAPHGAGLGLPVVQAASGAEVGECGQFVSGYTWGTVAQADIKLGGEIARSQSIQLVGQNPGGVASAPSSCSSTGSDFGTVSTLGANGILGVGQFNQDCGQSCASSATGGLYYACSDGNCLPTTMPVARQVSNPVANFDTDNNGVVLAFPAVGAQGAAGLTGTLTFGIGTQANNALGGATKYHTDLSGNFTTVYKGTRMPDSFIDSGSNGLFFTDATIPDCTGSSGFYCPLRALTLSATLQAWDGSASLPIGFTLQNVDTLPAGMSAGWVGGPNGTKREGGGSSFDWGLPFFFGRKVYVGMGSAAENPYWAF
jgi:hypothetical protein